jgi:dTMP kinase
VADLPSRGCFITFEGGEGSGKSTQAKQLHEALQSRGIPCHLTREPGGEEGAEAIRRLLVEGDPDRWEPVSELLLFLAARLQHYQRIIAPALAQGRWVICDRFHDSTRIYQGIARGLSLAYCDQLYAAILGNTRPDLTFYFDIDPRVGLARSTKRNHHETRFESLELSFHEKVRAGFLHAAAAEPQRFCVINVEGLTIPKVHEAVLAQLSTISMPS